MGEVTRLVAVLGPDDCTEELIFVHFDGISVPKLVGSTHLPHYHFH